MTYTTRTAMDQNFLTLTDPRPHQAFIGGNTHERQSGSVMDMVLLPTASARRTGPDTERLPTDNRYGDLGSVPKLPLTSTQGQGIY